MNRPIHNDHLVSSLRLSISDGASGLRQVPELVKVILREEAWRERVISQTGEIVQFDRFTDFVETAPLEGIGSDIKTLQRLCEDDEEAHRLLLCVSAEEALPIGGHGGDRKTENAASTLFNNVDRQRGTSSEYYTARIARDAPEVLEQMKAGAFKSVRAAAKAAGIIRDPTGYELLAKAWKKAAPEERSRFLAWALEYQEQNIG